MQVIRPFFNIFQILSDVKNGGTCFDNGGTDEFSCNCIDPFAGNECQTEICSSVESTVAKNCRNGGNCVIEVVDGIRTPRCDCPPNTQGELCYILPAACDGNPCQNSGICTRKIQPDNTQVCYVINHYDFSRRFSFIV